MILGRLTVGRGMYASDTLHVRPDCAARATAERLRVPPAGCSSPAHASTA